MLITTYRSVRLCRREVRAASFFSCSMLVARYFNFLSLEKEVNHIPRREIDRSVEVFMRFVGGEDSSRRVLCVLAPPAPWSTGAAHSHPSPAVAPATAVQFLTCFSV